MTKGMTKTQILKVLNNIFDRTSSTEFKINADGTIDTVYTGSDSGIAYTVTEANAKTTKIPFSFNKADGVFKCNMLGLTTLENSPKIVTSNFNCSHNELKSLEYGPEVVGGEYWCINNELTTLSGSPEKTHGFFCSKNQLKSLEGGPLEVTKEFNCRENPLTSLKGMPERVGEIFILGWNDNLPLLSLLKYNRVSVHFNNTVDDILEKYVGKKPLRPAIIQCQKDLIDAGFKGNALL